MKNNYILLALLPILFQGALYASDINQVIHQQLLSARKAMNSHVKSELDAVLPALLESVQTGAITKNAAIENLKAIKVALETYKSEQYPTYWSRYFGLTPEIVKNQIQPALDKVNNALTTLTAWTTSSYIKAGTAAILATTAIAVSGVAIKNSWNSQSGNAQKSSKSLREKIDYAQGSAHAARITLQKHANEQKDDDIALLNASEYAQAGSNYLVAVINYAQAVIDYAADVQFYNFRNDVDTSGISKINQQIQGAQALKRILAGVAENYRRFLLQSAEYINPTRILAGRALEVGDALYKLAADTDKNLNN